MYEFYLGNPYLDVESNRTNSSVNKSAKNTKMNFILANTDAVNLATGNESSLSRPTGNIDTNNKESASKPTLLPAPSYYKTFVWYVPPNLTDFLVNPYRQFCRWRNGDDKEKKKIATMERWALQKKKANGERRSLLHIQFDCYGLMRQSPFGTGNWVQMMYLLRLAVSGDSERQMDLRLSCNDEGGEESLVLPWLMGHFSSERTMEVLHQYFQKHVNTKCYNRGWSGTGIGWMVPFIRQDMRHMAIALVGIPDSSHPANTWIQQNDVRYNTTLPYNRAQPLVPDVELDDVVIHFRCGDTMTSEETYFRFFKFHEFASRIDPDADSIGIVTQPFDKSNQARARDQADAFRSHICRRVIVGFQNYLQARFPRARIRIHNDPIETVALAYARLIMARRQAFAFPDSSFSIFPALASFGVSYHFYPLASPYYAYTPKNQFITDVFPYIQNAQDGRCEWMRVPTNQSLFSIETLHMQRRLQRPSDAIFEWFFNDTVVKPQFPEIKTFRHG